MKRIVILSAGALAVAIPSLAASPADGPPRVASVAISNIVNEIARNTSIDSSRIPLSVQVPMDVAAAVCGLSPGVLTRQAETGMAQCTAQRTSSDLEDIVRQRVRDNEGK